MARLKRKTEHLWSSGYDSHAEGRQFDPGQVYDEHAGRGLCAYVMLVDFNFDGRIKAQMRRMCRL